MARSQVQAGDVQQSQEALGGLSQVVGQAGAPELQGEIAELSETPGGAELLFTVAAEEMMKAQGIPKKDSKKVRLYAMGGPTDRYQRGGLAEATERVRAAGRDEDDVLVHMTPDEFDVVQSIWGKPDINPRTNMPEYGFLKKVFKKVKRAVKKIVKNPIFQAIAPIALNFVAPGLGAAIGGALGASGTAAGMVGQAVIGGGFGALSGGAKGALTGALSGAVGAGFGKTVGKQLGLSGRTADIVGSGLARGMGSAATGGDFTQGALMGGLGAVLRPVERSKERVDRALGLSGKGTDITPDTARATVDVGEMTPDITRAGADVNVDPVWGTEVDRGIMNIAAGASPDRFDLGNLGALAKKYAIPGLLVAGALGGGRSGAEAPPPPELPAEFYEPLPQYEFQRGRNAPVDYYTYGRAGSATPGEAEFFSNNTLGQEAFKTPAALTDPLANLTPNLPAITYRGQQPTGGGSSPFSARGQTGGAPPGFVLNPAFRAPTGKTAMMRSGATSDPYGNPKYIPISDLAGGAPTSAGRTSVYAAEGGRMVYGPGSGRSDDIDAKLSDGEYVIDSESVALLGDGSSDAGARRLDEMRRNLRKHKSKNFKRGEFSHKAKAPEKYMKKAKGGKVKKTSYEDDILQTMMGAR